MPKTFDRHSQLYLRCVTRLPSTLQFEQSVKGKKEINSTLTNVNKVLSGQQRCIDSIKQANVPLACLSFNYITGSLSHILPRGQAILRHIWALVHMCGYACAWIITCVCVALCLLVDSITLHLLKWAALPGALVRKLRPAAMLASIDSPGLGLRWGSLSLVAPPRWPTLGQSSGGEKQGEISWAQIRGPWLSQWRHESAKWYDVSLYTQTVTSNASDLLKQNSN